MSLYNGNLNFRLPLAQVGGRSAAQFTIGLALQQRWRIERFQPQCGPPCTPVDYPVDYAYGGLPVGYGPGTMIGRRVAEDPTEMLCTQQYYGDTISRLTFTAGDGTEYELIDQLTSGTAFSVIYVCGNMPPQYGGSRGTIFVTRNGSAATFISDTVILDANYSYLGAQFYPSGYLVMRDGTRYRIDEGLVSWTRDRNGNKLTFNYHPDFNSLTEVYDSLNRRVWIDYLAWGEEIHFKGFGGGVTRTIRVEYSPLENLLRSGSIQRVSDLFPETLTPDTSYYNPIKVSAVVLPDGQRSYQFRYNSYGELARVVLPTGGRLSTISREQPLLRERVPSVL